MARMDAFISRECCRNQRDQWKARAEKAEAENAKLNTIVDDLPKTADGVPVTDGMELFHPTITGMFGIHGRLNAYFIVPDGEDEGAHVTMDVGSCYSTPDRAQAAKEKGDD